jgi:hypothetical protein
MMKQRVTIAVSSPLSLSKRWALNAAIFICGLTLLRAPAHCTPSIASSRAEYQGLVVEFKSLCRDGDIWLESALYNATGVTVDIKSGKLPSDYYPTGTLFQVESAGKSLARKNIYPTIGHLGPIQLSPRERRVGLTPIGFLFPEMSSTLARQSVNVSWEYTPHLKGVLTIAHDPCVP